MQLSNKLDAAQIAQFSPETVARIIAALGREAIGGDHVAQQTREAMIDAWMQHRGFENRAQAIGDLVEIEIGRHRGRRP